MRSQDLWMTLLRGSPRRGSDYLRDSQDMQTYDKYLLTGVKMGKSARK